MRFYNEKAIWLIPIDFAAKNKQTNKGSFVCMCTFTYTAHQKKN